MKTNNNFHILIVDDEKFNIELAAAYLQEEGYKLSFALNAQAVIESVTNSKIDLILLDINMPQKDGFAICSLLKADPKTASIPVIFLTAQTDEEYISKAFELGGVDYITKPFKGVELKVRVATHLKNLAYLEEIKHKQSKLAQLSITDPLTKLYNALYFESQIKSFAAKNENFWFVYITIDKFEKLNTLYGFTAANKIIRLFAKILEDAVPSGAVIARLHGVNFAMVIKNYETNVMKNIYRKITANLAKEKKIASLVTFTAYFYNVKKQSDTNTAALYKRAQESIAKLQEKGERYLFVD